MSFYTDITLQKYILGGMAVIVAIIGFLIYYGYEHYDEIEEYKHRNDEKIDTIEFIFKIDDGNKKES